MKIVIAILVMVPFTLWLQRFLDNVGNQKNHPNSSNKKENDSDRQGH
jgi:hypothetical protein